MLIDRCKLQAGHNVLIWGAAGGLGVFATQLCKAAGRERGRRRLLRREGRAGQAARRGRLHQPQRVRRDDAHRRRDRRDGARRSASRPRAGFAKRVKEILGDAPDIVFEHVGQATFPTSVFIVKPFGKVVICGATSGYTLDFDVRYLWMKQKEILGSHFANAYECMRANQLMAEGKIRPVLWQVMGFDGVAEAHQLLHENKHLGQDLDHGRRHRRRAGQARGRRRARSGPRSAPERRSVADGRGRRTTSTGTSTRCGRERWLRDLAPGARPGARLRRHAALSDPRRGRPAPLPPGRPSGTTAPTSSATGTRTRSRRCARRRSTTTTSPFCRAGTRSRSTPRR